MTENIDINRAVAYKMNVYIMNLSSNGYFEMRKAAYTIPWKNKA